MTYNIKVKRTIQQTEIIIGTTVENKEDVGIKVKELHELINAYQKKVSPSQEKPTTPKLSPMTGMSRVSI